MKSRPTQYQHGMNCFKLPIVLVLVVVLTRGVWCRKRSKRESQRSVSELELVGILYSLETQEINAQYIVGHHFKFLKTTFSTSM